MSNFKFFNRRVRIVTLIIFLCATLSYRVGSTPVPLYYATIGALMHFFDEKQIYSVVVKRDSLNPFDLRMEGRPLDNTDVTCSRLNQVKLLKRNYTIYPDLCYELISWNKVKGIWAKSK